MNWQDGLPHGLLPISRLRSADPLRNTSVYSLGFLGLAARSLHDVVPRLRGGVVLAADRVAVDVGGRAYRRVSEAGGDGCEVHAVSQQEARMAVSQDVERCSL